MPMSKAASVSPVRWTTARCSASDARNGPRVLFINTRACLTSADVTASAPPRSAIQALNACSADARRPGESAARAVAAAAEVNSAAVQSLNTNG